eukprot:TRINITY_DN3852_c0_g1_i2.p1 TRINITY_DN3852_c0_g1~~TRINITY_DN3852_c0_g1_i2.p1  ORF type:complete len:765 (-),score=119.64 TRINITY_DN3852_c0_g1_i2:53-2347(-)
MMMDYWYYYVTTLLLLLPPMILLFKHLRSGQSNPLDIHEAIQQGYMGYLDQYLPRQLELLDNDGQTPLLHALREGKHDIALYLLDQGASTLVNGINMFSPLHTCIYYAASLDVVKRLLSSGADLNARDANQWNALHMAAVQNDCEIAEFVMMKGLSVDSKTKNSETPLIIASSNGFDMMVNILLCNSADTSVRTTPLLNTALSFASINGHLNCVKLILEHEKISNISTMNIPNLTGDTPLHLAAANDNIDVIKMFIHYGVDINKQRRNESNCLHIAVEKNSDDLLRFLLENGCNVNAKDGFGTTPLHRACSNKNLFQVKLLLEYGADTSVTDNDGLTVLHSLCISRKESGDEIVILEELLNTLSLTVRDRVNATILHTAVCCPNSLNIVKYIIDQEPSLLFEEDGSGLVPLHLLCQIYPNHSDIELVIREKIMEINPDFFENFDPTKKRVAQEFRIESGLSEEEVFNVLGGDISLRSFAERIKSGKSANIIILTGAGISTSCGLPDFRSQEKGLYNDKNMRLIFSSQGFYESTLDFMKIMKYMFLPVIRGEYSPSVTHYFISFLAHKNLLLRNYTQNIDTLELIAGLPSERLVEAHGSAKSATCCRCFAKCNDMDLYWNNIEKDIIPECHLCKAPFKPDVVLFGEPIPSSFHENLDSDFELCDMVIVMGTTLQVYPFSSLVNYPGKDIPRLLFNNEAVGPFKKAAQETIVSDSLQKTEEGAKGTYRDLAVLGDIDQGITQFLLALDLTDEFNEFLRSKGSTMTV